MKTKEERQQELSKILTSVEVRESSNISTDKIEDGAQAIIDKLAGQPIMLGDIVVHKVDGSRARNSRSKDRRGKPGRPFVVIDDQWGLTRVGHIDGYALKFKCSLVLERENPPERKEDAPATE